MTAEGRGSGPREARRKMATSIRPERTPVAMTARGVVVAAGALWWLTHSAMAAGDPGKLTIISPHWEGIRKEYSWAFEEWYRQQYGERVKVEWIDQGGTSDDVKFIKSEFEARPEGINIDLFWGGGIDPYIDLAEAGLLESYKLPDELLAPIPQDYFGLPMYDEQYRWYGTALAGFGIIINQGILRRLDLPTPATWKDLCDPRLYSWVGSGDPRSSGSVHMMYEIILQAYGWEEGLAVLTEMGANVRSFPKSSSQTPKDVAIGEAAVGLAIDIYALAQMAQAGSKDMTYVWPQCQTVINPDGMAILRGAPHRQIAQRFTNFVMSAAGQKLLMLAAGSRGGPREFQLSRMSVLPELYAELGPQCVVKVDPFQWTTALQYDARKGGLRWGLVNDLVGALIIDNHRELTRAWRALTAAGQPPEARAELVKAPLTEQQALKLAAEEWQGQERRNEEISSWVRFGQEKYRRAEALAGRGKRTGTEVLASVLRLAVPVFAGLLFLWTLADLFIRAGRGLIRPGRRR